VVTREPAVTVSGTPAGTPQAGAPIPDGGVRIAVVTHGPASSKFWAIIRNGVDAASRTLDVLVDYRAPDVYSAQRMSDLIDAAVASKPDGLVVSIPEPAVAPAIRRAVRAGIPVVSINSGSQLFKKLGVLAHVGQIEDRAGLEAGERLAAAGVKHALCVNQQVGNTGLDARCAGLARAMQEAGGDARVLGVVDDDPDTPRKIAEAVAKREVTGVLCTNAVSGLAAVQGLAGTGVKIGTFDLGPDVL
jgi:simple sugar transport system substrate-binding protein